VLQQQHDAGGEVAHDVLQGEAEGDGGQAQAADQHRGVEPAERQRHHDADGDDAEIGQLGHQQAHVRLGGGAAEPELRPAPHSAGDQHGDHQAEQRRDQVGELLDERVGPVLERLGKPFHGRTASS
jgi:hypothetical protein